MVELVAGLIGFVLRLIVQTVAEFVIEGLWELVKWPFRQLLRWRRSQSVASD